MNLIKLFTGINTFLTKAVEFLIFRFTKMILKGFLIYLIYTLSMVGFYFCYHGNLSNEMLIHALEAVDVVMIATLIVMIMTGSYNAFVSKEHGYEGEKVGSGLMKVKMASSIIGISSIHMLSTFIQGGVTNWDTIFSQVTLHVAFILGVLALAWVDYLHSKGENLHSSKH